MRCPVGGAACGAGVDYVSSSGILTFNPGDTSKSVDVTICGDNLAEGSEAFMTVEPKRVVLLEE